MEQTTRHLHFRYIICAFWVRKLRKNQNMKKETIQNEEVAAEAAAAETSGGATAEPTSHDNVSEGDAEAADKMTDDSSDVPTAEQTAAEVAEWKDKFVRLQAEFDNYRKRTLREKMELVETGGKEVLKAMLPVRDDVERAIAAMEKSEDIEALREGVRLIAQKFSETLRQRGVTEIEAKGQPFDPDRQEAVAKFAAGEEQKGRVIDVVQTGYMLGDKVLRFAKVVVGE